MFTCDAKLQITWGYALGDELPQGPVTVIAEDDRPALQIIVEQVLTTGGTGKHAELALELGGERRTYDLRVELTSPTTVTVVGFDITSSLAARASLIDADRRKDEFLATLSHELRNPLTPLKVALEVARLSAHDPAKVASTHAIMERQVNAMTTLVDELLDLSRITQGKIELEKESLEPISIVESALEVTRPLIAQHNHELSVDAVRTTARVLGDPSRLAQILVNLISNAAKYTPRGGQIKVSARLDETGRRVVFRVADNGAGIDPDLLPHVFEIFVQSRDHRGRAKGGLGIGLALVKQLVELHGGTVAANSDGKRGSEFVVELPVLR